MTQNLRIGDVAEIFDGPHATPRKVAAGPIFLGISNLVDGRINLDSAEYLAEDDFAYWTRRVTPLPGDIVFSYETRLGEAALIPEGLRCCLGRRMGLLRVRRELADPRYVLYAYLGPSFQEVIRQRTVHGSTVDRIPLTEMDAFPFPLPALSEQRSVAALLGAVDDKIELNRQMNETLEAMARALFKSWFVDFDPVRATMAGRSPFGTDAATAALFPAKRSLEGIPHRWIRRPLGEWADALSGGTPSKRDPSLWGGEVPWISPKSMTEIFADEAESFVTSAAIGNGMRLAPVGATLVMVRGMGLHEHVRVSQARCEVAFNQDVKALVPRGIMPSLLLLALLDAQAELLLKVESSGHGTGKLPSEILLAHPITMPALDVQQGLTTTFDMLLDKIVLARQESRTLAKLRDLLLPKLLSGELRIREAEKAVEAVL
jgi:type I restriction enzyme S subunit